MWRIWIWRFSQKMLDIQGDVHHKTGKMKGSRWICGSTLLNHLEVVGKWLAACYTRETGMYLDILQLANHLANAGNQTWCFWFSEPLDLICLKMGTQDLRPSNNGENYGHWMLGVPNSETSFWYPNIARKFVFVHLRILSWCETHSIPQPSHERHLGYFSTHLGSSDDDGSKK